MSAPMAYARDQERCNAGPIFVPGEIYQWYLNFDDPINDPAFGTFRLDLHDRFGTLVAAGVGSLTKDIVIADFYNIIMSVAMPVVPNGYYYFAIYDTAAAVTKATSSQIIVENTDYIRNTAFVSYRNKFDIFNIQYEKNPNYYTKLRLPLIEVDYQFENENKQYRNVSDKRLRTFHRFNDEVSKIESYYFDKGMHRAAAAMYQHTEIFINNVSATVKGSYQRENNLFSVFSKASIDVILDLKIPVPVAAKQNTWFLITSLNDEITNFQFDFIVVDF